MWRRRILSKLHCDCQRACLLLPVILFWCWVEGGMQCDALFIHTVRPAHSIRICHVYRGCVTICAKYLCYNHTLSISDCLFCAEYFFLCYCQQMVQNARQFGEVLQKDNEVWCGIAYPSCPHSL
eukprot:GHVQ01004803.1.p1 GENE.GHVQ01004803.1~~GHVQ01004803.1.p1  ORF type:complete len:124 (+),score=4.82 GHVQ01004803.1:264-635(+)